MKKQLILSLTIKSSSVVLAITTLAASLELELATTGSTATIKTSIFSIISEVSSLCAVAVNVLITSFSV